MARVVLRQPIDSGRTYGEMIAEATAAAQRVYLLLLCAEHKTVSAAVRASGMDRKYLYRLAERLGVQLPRRSKGKP